MGPARSDWTDAEHTTTNTGVEQIRDDNADTYWQSDGAQPHLINVQFHKKMTVLEVALYLDYALDESYTPKKVGAWVGGRTVDRGFGGFDLCMCGAPWSVGRWVGRIMALLSSEEAKKKTPTTPITTPLLSHRPQPPTQQIAIKAGTTCHDLVEVHLVELHEPQGWVRVPLRNPHVEPPGLLVGGDVAAGGGSGSGPGGGLLRAHLIQVCILAMHQNGRDTHVRQVRTCGVWFVVVRGGRLGFGDWGLRVGLRRPNPTTTHQTITTR